MSVLNFPFWIITQRRGLISHPVEPSGMRGFIVAFSRAEDAAKFMVSRGETEWENRLVSRSTLRNLMADLRQIGVQGLVFNPTNDDCGAKITFEELESL